MPPAPHTLTFQHGEAYRRLRTIGTRVSPTVVEPLDLTGYAYVCEIRRELDADSELLLRAATDNARIALGGAEGTVRYELDVATVLTLPVGKWWHDEALVQPDGEPIYLDRGPVIVKERISVWAP